MKRCQMHNLPSKARLAHNCWNRRFNAIMRSFDRHPQGRRKGVVDERIVVAVLVQVVVDAIKKAISVVALWYSNFGCLDHFCDHLP